MAFPITTDSRPIPGLTTNQRCEKRKCVFLAFELRTSTFTQIVIMFKVRSICNNYVTDAILLTTYLWILYCIFDTLNNLK